MKTHENTQAAFCRRGSWRRRVVRLVGAGFAIGMLLGASSGVARPRQPLPSLPDRHLRVWRFDDAFRQYPLGQAPASIPEADLVESWSGYALRREGASAVPFVVPELEPTNRVNFTCGTGTIRFWFQPTWGSASASGRGPGGYARLVELGGLTGDTPTVWWSLYATPDGTALYASGQGPVGPADFLRAEIQWPAATWHLVTLTYSPTSSALFVDGELAGVGEPLPAPQVFTGSELALVLGSDLTGANLAQGQFDELATFSRSCDALEVEWYYGAIAKRTVLGPVSEAELSAQLRPPMLASRVAASAAVLSEDGSQMLLLQGGTSECITNVPVFITKTVSCFTNGGWTVTFDIQGGTNGLLYDIFSSTNLVGNDLTNAQWLWLEQGPTCSRYQYTNQPAAHTFYVLGTPLDSDGDGLTDAFEKLITCTNVNTNDTDGDGVSDYFEWLQGRNPNVAGAVSDSNNLIRLELYTPLH